MNAVAVDVSTTGSLDRKYDLAKDRSMQTQHYIIRSELATHSNKGILKSTDVYSEHLTVQPGNRADGEADRFTCTAFMLQRGNAPEVAILGLTRSVMKPVWNGKEFVPRLMQPLHVTFDHRVVDGAEAARFTVHLSKLLADLKRLVL